MVLLFWIRPLYLRRSGGSMESGSRRVGVTACPPLLIRGEVARDSSSASGCCTSRLAYFRKLSYQSCCHHRYPSKGHYPSNSEEDTRPTGDTSTQYDQERRGHTSWAGVLFAIAGIVAFGW